MVSRLFETERQRQARQYAEAKAKGTHAPPLPGQSTLAPGTTEGSQEELDAWSRAQAYKNNPSNPMGNISIKNQGNVNAAYQRMMQHGAQADQDVGILNRGLTSSLEASAKNRLGALSNANISANDRGMLNSGIALNRQQELNTGYDTTDRQINNNVTDSLGAIARKRLEMRQGYDDSILEGNRLTTQDAADAEAANLLAQAQAEQDRKDHEAAIAALSPQPIAAPVVEPLALAPVAAQVLQKKRVIPIPVRPKVQPKLKLRGYS